MVNVSSRFMSNPQETHLDIVLNISREFYKPWVLNTIKEMIM
jgi:hypothetical protein